MRDRRAVGVRWIMSKYTVPILIGCLLFVPSGADANTELCDAVLSACEYSDQNAPLLEEDVCYERGGTPEVYLKGSGNCPAGTFEYFVKHGEVINATTDEVQAYVPLDDACDHPGTCTSGNPPIGSTTAAQALCCEFGDCVPLTEVLCNGPDDIAVWCEDGVTNADGTVECFDGVPL